MDLSLLRVDSGVLSSPLKVNDPSSPSSPVSPGKYGDPNTPSFRIGPPMYTPNDSEDDTGRLKTRINREIRIANQSETLGDVALVKEIVNHLKSGPQPDQERRKSVAELSYLMTVEERLRQLESKVGHVDIKKNTKHTTLRPTKQDTMSPPWKLEPAWMTWDEFLYSMPPAGSQVHGRWTRSPPSVFDVVVRPVPTSVKMIGVQLASDEVPTNFPLVSPDERRVERIRINSEFICDILRSFLGTGSRMRYRTHIRPFKLLLTYENDMREYVRTLRSDIERRNSSPSGGSVINATADQSNAPTGSTEEKTLDVDRNTADHLECLLTFMDKYLADEIAQHRQLRSRENAAKSAKVAFKDLWSLFGPGDVIFDPVASQAFRVLTVCNGRRKLRNRAVGPFPPAENIIIGGLAPLASSSSSASVPFVEALGSAEEDLSPFIITCFYLDFDGKEAGPVQKRIDIAPFDNARDIKSLKVFPIEYANVQSPRASSIGTESCLSQADSLSETLLERGRKFTSLAHSNQVAHKEYNGLSLGLVQEQIDSEVIIDLDLYYRDKPALMPVLGLSEPEEGDYRETTETFPVFGGHDDWDLNLFDDRDVDKARRTKFLSKVPEIVRYHSNQQPLKDRFAMLFPPSINGFVLKSRHWYTNKVRNLPLRRQNFDDLILPDGYKDLVESLVKNHSRGAKPVQGAEGSRFEPESSHHRDIVRGKGKGTIILLHGVPGVGKTSTAECVAEYTQRPLFALTCGDIGETPQEVQENLTKNFYLAHRWGCVMLLDEADVFLQSRDKRDLKRNAVVSVFLRILEYYTGILSVSVNAFVIRTNTDSYCRFLTTNKVGNFDEAFKSRIHVSLYYKPLSPKQTKRIWEVNLRRVKENKPNITFDDDDILDWVKNFRDALEKEGLRPWNGRQIHNACQTAVALAEFRDKGKLGVKHLNAVAKASKEFDIYLKATHGMDDLERAEIDMERGEDAFEKLMSAPKKSRKGGKKSRKKRRQASSSEDSESDTSHCSKSQSESD